MFDATFQSNGCVSAVPFSSFIHSVPIVPPVHRFNQAEEASSATIAKSGEGASFIPYSLGSSSMSATNAPDIHLLPPVNLRRCGDGLSKSEDDRECVRSGVSNGDSVESAQHICQDCGKAFGERSLLTRHRVSHSTAKFMCHLCSRPFMRDDKLKRHIRCVHSSERPFKCDVCSKAFARKDKLQEHVRHHNKDITFTCSVCSEIFVMRSHLNRHLRTVHNMKVNSVNSTQLCTNNSSSFPSTHDLNENKSAFTPVNNFPVHSLYNQLSNHSGSTSGAISGDIQRKTTNLQQKSSISRRSTAEISYPNCLKAEPANDSLFRLMSFNNNHSAVNTSYAAASSQSLLPSASSYPIHTGSQLSNQNSFCDTTVYPTTSIIYQCRQPVVEHGIYGSLQNPPSSWSAAMAASLLAPVNYAGWWTHPSGSTTDGLHFSYPNNSSDSSTEPGSGIGTIQSPLQWDARQGHQLAPTNMFASLPSFAQAMYYQAATWAATKNGMDPSSACDIQTYRFTSPNTVLSSDH